MSNKKIKFLIMDVDGTLTDGKLYIGENGEIMKAFDVKDGYGIKIILPQYGIQPMILTARRSEILEKRCSELDIKYLFQGINDKKEKLCEIIEQFQVSKDDIAYIGDDITDLECMKICGIKGAPVDAVQEIKDICDFVSKQNGGSGAVREFIEWIVRNSYGTGI